SGKLIDAETGHLDVLNLDFPLAIPGVEDRFVNPRQNWGDSAAYDEQARKLARLFQDNIQQFSPAAAVVAAGPRAD
ncbi:MAG TPA: phosphoenolpyruvate carboxykinase (ATP), partial [Pseudohaliea sp.]|nr:phosphoenolpyruvate carboxykinase (ATP) [Pseudohaliea sp.]